MPVSEIKASKLRTVTVKKHFCKGCGICVNLCPKKVLALDSQGKASVQNPSLCTGCSTCETHCPDFALRLEVN